MGVDAFNWDSFVLRVVESNGSMLKAAPNVSISNIKSRVVNKECGQKGTGVKRVGSDVYIPPTQGAHGATEHFTVMLLVDTDTFPTILLVVQFQRCSVGRQNVLGVCKPAELTETPCMVPFEESDILEAKLNRLF